ncbi:hypothetical protein OROMI_004538 [Orobanche minor]
MAGSSESFGDAGIIELIGKIVVVAVVILLFVVVFIFCLHLYAKYFWYLRRRENPNTATATAASRHPESAIPSRGLEPCVLKTLPVVIFDPKEFKFGLECAVCLSEISQGEETRLLPKCNHGFHLDCIDMWFGSHSTCPLCRNPIKLHNQPNSTDESTPAPGAVTQTPMAENSGPDTVFPTEAPDFPTNVLIYGDETRVSTFAHGVEENNDQILNSNAVAELSSSSSMMSPSSGGLDGISIVDIPRRLNEDDEQKSPLPRRLRSLKRLLSYSNRSVNPSGSRNLDLEQGGGRC